MLKKAAIPKFEFQTLIRKSQSLVSADLKHESSPAVRDRQKILMLAPLYADWAERSNDMKERNKFLNQYQQQ